MKKTKLGDEKPPLNKLCCVTPEFGEGSFEAYLETGLFETLVWRIGSSLRSVSFGDQWVLVENAPTPQPVNDHGLTKYDRPIKGAKQGTIDVYAVIETFDVRCPARQHAIKKLLCSGIRGKGNAIQDLKETKVAIDRAIKLQEEREQNV